MSLIKTVEMEAMLASLEKHLDRRDMIGYAAARNTRLLRDELVEFMTLREKLVIEHGDIEEDGDGAPTGKSVISQQSPGFVDFMAEYMPLCEIEHDFQPFTIPYEEAIGNISGTELLEIDWMFHEESE